MKTKKQMLIEFKENFSELSLDNNGYERLSSDILDKYKKEISDISSIIKLIDESFIEFNNFKPRNDGSFDLRYKSIWSYSPYFIGVRYLNINDIID